jgi:hypothetical protein
MNNPTIGDTKMSSIETMSLEDAANAAAGNWQKFNSFVWWRAREMEDAADFGIYYTHHRDSGLLDQSNAAVIAKALEPFTDGDDSDVIEESHNHWAVGHIDGFAIRVFRNGEITEAFKVYHDLTERMDGYPILDESDYSEREFNATLENIADAAWRLKHDYDLPDGWEAEAFSWFWEHNQRAVENRDDQGGYPCEEDLEAAFDALGYPRAA